MTKMSERERERKKEHVLVVILVYFLKRRGSNPIIKG